MFSFTRERRFDPGMGTISSPFASSQAKASCAGVHFFCVAISSIFRTSRMLLSKLPG